MALKDHTIYIGLGTNIGEREKNIEKAIELLKEKCGEIRQAPLYESTPSGFKEQNNFINTALKAVTTLLPLELLHFIKSIEQKLGRVERFKNGPREIDMDLLFYDDIMMNTPELIIPHPKILERDFVLRPLIDLDPNFTHPVTGTLLSETLTQLGNNKHVLS